MIVENIINLLILETINTNMYHQMNSFTSAIHSSKSSKLRDERWYIKIPKKFLGNWHKRVLWWSGLYMHLCWIFPIFGINYANTLISFFDEERIYHKAEIAIGRSSYQGKDQCEEFDRNKPKKVRNTRTNNNNEWEE